MRNPSNEPCAARVLIVDDECGDRRFLHASLCAEGYHPLEASTGREALRAVASARPDLVILDPALPDLDGIDVTRSLREWTDIPIVVLSVRNREADKIAALDAGADDYLTKPFALGELFARIRAALRRAGPREPGPVFVAGCITVDLAAHSVRCGDRPVQLTPTEYELLRILVRHPGEVLTHRRLIREMWGGACHEDDLHLLRVNVSNLRHKLEEDPAKPRYLITQPGVGYTLRTE